MSNDTGDVGVARSRWLIALANASKLSGEMYAPGTGYGDPDALAAAQHRLQEAKDEAQRLFCDWQDQRVAKLQRSQTVTAWTAIGISVLALACGLAGWLK